MTTWRPGVVSLTSDSAASSFEPSRPTESGSGGSARKSVTIAAWKPGLLQVNSDGAYQETRSVDGPLTAVATAEAVVIVPTPNAAAAKAPAAGLVEVARPAPGHPEASHDRLDEQTASSLIEEGRRQAAQSLRSWAAERVSEPMYSIVIKALAEVFPDSVAPSGPPPGEAAEDVEPAAVPPGD